MRIGCSDQLVFKRHEVIPARNAPSDARDTVEGLPEPSRPPPA